MSLLVEDWVGQFAYSVACTAILVYSSMQSVVVKLARQERRYDASRGMSLLVEDWVARASALQRRGRAGRVRPGRCFGLYTRARFEERMRKYQVTILKCYKTGFTRHVRPRPLLRAVHARARMRKYQVIILVI